MAIGAKSRDVLIQFLLEAIIMSGLGGILGIIFGITVAETLRRFISFAPVIQVSSIVLALTFSAGVGVFFGYYPARRASRLDPIEALQYE